MNRPSRAEQRNPATDAPQPSRVSAFQTEPTRSWRILAAQTDEIRYSGPLADATKSQREGARMNGDPDEGEHVERLLDAAERTRLHDDPLAALLDDAAAPDTKRALAGEDAAVAAFRSAHPARIAKRRRFRPQLSHRAAATMVLSAVIIALVAAFLPLLIGSAPDHKPSLSPTTARPSANPSAPSPANTNARSLANNTTLISQLPNTPGGSPGSQPGTTTNPTSATHPDNPRHPASTATNTAPTTHDHDHTSRASQKPNPGQTKREQSAA